MSDNILRNILQQNINRWQIAAYAAANITGLLIITLAIQLFRDAAPVLSHSSDSDPLESARYIVVSPQPKTSLFKADVDGIDGETLAAIKANSWVDTVGCFIPSGFDVNVGVAFAGNGFSTAMFFEGIPREFLDCTPDRWDFDPANPSVPIILPRDYLTLYNFGFAPTRGLPTLSEAAISRIPLRITLSGNGLSTTLPGRVVAFTDRLNTIAVPEDFITWANQRFSPNTSPTPKRAVIRINDPGNPAIDNFLTDNNLRRDSASESAAGMLQLLKIATTVIIAVGLLISILAVGLLIMSIFLFLQKNRVLLSRLIDLGYSQHSIIRYYCRLIGMLNLLLTLCVGAILCLIQFHLGPALENLGLTCSSVIPTLLILVAIILLLTAAGYAVIRNIIHKIW